MNGFRISDHAMYRYLERVCGIDIAPILADMAAKGYGPNELEVYLAREHRVALYGIFEKALPSIVRAIKELSDHEEAKIVFSGWQYVIKDKTLVTIKRALDGEVSEACT